MPFSHSKWILCVGASFLAASAAAQDVSPSEFANPPVDYRPTITTEEGAGYQAPLSEAAERAINDLNAGGIMISPQDGEGPDKPLDVAGLASVAIGLQDSYPATATPWLPKALPGEAKFGSYFADGRGGPGAEQSFGYMTSEWFAKMRELLELAKASGRSAVYYDEAGFPSGSADGTIPPNYYRQILRRDETTVSSGQKFTVQLDLNTAPVALVALDTTTGNRVDLLADAVGRQIEWTAPRGDWKVQTFSVQRTQGKNTSPDYYATADYLDPTATNWFLEHAYDRAYAGLSSYFGSPIEYTFFDDVGIYSDEKTWHPDIAKRFEELTGRPAALYYPALWEDIGGETAAARVAFYRARSEQLGDTFPKLLTDWAHRHGVKSTGHAPGNYDIQPTDTIGDPFKFYAHTDMPMADVLWGLGFARGGFKLISSVSAQRDLPRTAAEAFSVNNDANGYRRMIELFVRGFNYFVMGARVPSQPVSSGEEFVNWAGRSSYLLQGGRHIADIAVLFPIESLQAFYSFNDPRNSATLPAGAHAYRDADYQAVGEMLLSELRRDFTFVHPDALGSEKLSVSGDTLTMTNEVNSERYKVLIIPGGDVISVAAIAKANEFFQAGGSVIATSLLPTRSAEFGRDQEVKNLVAAIFGTGEFAPGGDVRRNANGGRALYLANPTPAGLQQAFEKMAIEPDVAFPEGQPAVTGPGTFSYIHRQRDGKDIYYFGNSGDSPVKTRISLRGRLEAPEFWDPHKGTVTKIEDVRITGSQGHERTEFELLVPAVSSIAVVSDEP